MKNKEFFQALDDLAVERDIKQDELIDYLQSAISAGYKKESGEARPVSLILNPEKSTIKFIAYQTVVEEVEDPEKEISLEDAKKIKTNIKVGETLTEDIDIGEFTRIAAQTVKQVITQKLNDVKKLKMNEEMKNKEGEIVSAQIRKIEGENIYVSIADSQMEGVMLKGDQIPDEKYSLGQILKVYVKTIRTNTKTGANQVLVSRTNVGFIKRLFESEIPEIKTGLVTIKKIVREPGYRTKIAIEAKDPTIDAVGACIGQKGMRISAIVSELNGENIDIVPYSADPVEFIARALSPAKVIAVSINQAEQKAKALVPDEAYLKAIGKKGCNAKLAVKLTDWKIDVKKMSEDGGEVR